MTVVCLWCESSRSLIRGITAALHSQPCSPSLALPAVLSISSNSSLKLSARTLALPPLDICLLSIGTPPELVLVLPALGGDSVAGAGAGEGALELAGVEVVEVTGVTGFTGVGT